MPSAALLTEIESLRRLPPEGNLTSSPEPPEPPSALWQSRSVKYRFFDDYSEGAHPAILAAIATANEGQQPGYGLDEHCELARRRVQHAFATDGDVHFVTGATQANFIGLSAMLRPHEGVISPTSGHIHVHETGAVEATGHKIITVDAPQGKLTPWLVDEALATHEDEHTVRPRAVYLTQATETGSVYNRDEFFSLVRHAKSKGLYVYVDGARLAMALASTGVALTAPDIAACGVDMFCIGGTKNGGLFGDAIVIVNPNLRTDFRYLLKRHGALLAKGRFLGTQFARFFDDDGLWLELGNSAVTKAAKLGQGLAQAGVTLQGEVQGNQVFAELDNTLLEKLSDDYGFYTWARLDERRSVARFVCSWATPDAAVEQFVADVASLQSLTTD